MPSQYKQADARVTRIIQSAGFNEFGRPLFKNLRANWVRWVDDDDPTVRYLQPANLTDENFDPLTTATVNSNTMDGRASIEGQEVFDAWPETQRFD